MEIKFHCFKDCAEGRLGGVVGVRWDSSEEALVSIDNKVKHSYHSLLGLTFGGVI